MQSKTTAGRKRHNVKKAPGIYNKLDRHGNRRYEIAYRDSDGRLRFKVVPGNLEAAKAARAAIVDRKARGERASSPPRRRLRSTRTAGSRGSPFAQRRSSSTGTRTSGTSSPCSARAGSRRSPSMTWPPDRKEDAYGLLALHDPRHSHHPRPDLRISGASGSDSRQPG
jgi:hypothetical protein